MARSYPLAIPASRAYAAWRSRYGGRPWDDLTRDEQAAWIAVAAAVLEWAEAQES